MDGVAAAVSQLLPLQEGRAESCTLWALPLKPVFPQKDAILSVVLKQN